MTRTKADLAELEARIGYSFKDATLAERALTHVSAPTPARAQSYQRLEFLGDRVLGLVVSHMLYEAFPQASEGDLSVRLARLVRRETCAEVAESWSVGPHVVMGAGEARGGGRGKAAILGDVCEALIGAVFVDAGFEAAQGAGAPLLGAAHARRRSADPGRQDRRAGMGASARPADAPLCRGRAQRPRASAALHHAGGAGRLRAGAGRGLLEARRRAGRRPSLSRTLDAAMKIWP